MNVNDRPSGGDASSSLGHVILTDQKPTGEFERNLFKEEESEGEDYLCKTPENTTFTFFVWDLYYVFVLDMTVF